MGKPSKLINRIQPTDTRTATTPIVKRIVGRHLTKIRERILLRDEYTCQQCGRVTIDLEVDHIVPLHMGGSETDANRQCLCREPCHRLKSEQEEKERGNP